MNEAKNCRLASKVCDDLENISSKTIKAVSSVRNCYSLATRLATYIGLLVASRSLLVMTRKKLNMSDTSLLSARMLARNLPRGVALAVSVSFSGCGWLVDLQSNGGLTEGTRGERPSNPASEVRPDAGNAGETLSSGRTVDAGSGAMGDPPETNGGTPSSNSDWEPAVIPANSPVALQGVLRVEGPQLVNAHGEPVQLKGVSSMWLNWESTGYAESFDALTWMRDNWNLSVIRAAMGVEPNGGYLDNPDRSLEKVRTIVRNAIDAGVYVIIDWHDHSAELHQTEAIEFFQLMAEEFGQFPNVIYETYNEPENNQGIKPWNTMLKPYHEAVVAALRAIDPDNVAILGTGQWSQRVDLASNDPLSGDNLMYAVHFYACSHADEQRDYARLAYDNGLAIFVSEWGATSANGGINGEGGICVEEATAWHDFMNARQISWAAWKLDDCSDVSCLLRPRASRNGNWTDSDLQGHAPFVIARMLE